MIYSSEGYNLISKGYEEIRRIKEAEKKADIKNQQEKDELENEQKANVEPVKKMSAEEMQEHITLLSQALVELTEKINER